MKDKTVIIMDEYSDAAQFAYTFRKFEVRGGASETCYLIYSDNKQYS